MKNWLCAFLATVVVVGVGFEAQAQTSPTKEDLLQADFAALINLAREAYEAEDYEAAIERLALANRQNPHSRLLINIARSHLRNGDCRTGLAYFAAFLRHPEAEEALIEETRQNLAEGAAECAAFNEELGGRLILESEPLFARAYVDDRFIGVTPTETAGLPAGAHNLRLVREGYADHVEQIEVTPKEDLRIGAVLKEPHVEEPRVEEPPLVPAGEPEHNLIAYGLLGAGVLALGTGMYFDLGAIPRLDREREVARVGGDSARVEELTAERQRNATFALAGYVGGGLLLAGGASWLIYDLVVDDQDEPNPLVWRISPDLHPGAMGFTLMRRF